MREATDTCLIASVSATSPKVAQLAAGKWEVLCFWSSLKCRLRGHAHLQHDEATAASWRTRPKASRLADTYHASVRPQSSRIASREALLAEVDALAHVSGDLTQCPETVATLVLQPTQIEIWLGSIKDRLHDRRLYSLTANGLVGASPCSLTLVSRLHAAILRRSTRIDGSSTITTAAERDQTSNSTRIGSPSTPCGKQREKPST